MFAARRAGRDPSAEPRRVWLRMAPALVVVVPVFAVAVGLAVAQNFGILPLIGRSLRNLNASAWPLLCLKILLVALFLLVIVAGLQGSPIPERNIATVLTWNWWWAGLVFSVFFLGSAWCAVCPWNTLADWVVRGQRLNLRVPRFLRSLWPALWLLIALTWLELGVGITTNPYATAVLALVMVVIFIAGFFIDFIEITFIIVPIVVPIFVHLDINLLWLGILIAMNLQTSFLTPPFGFALFYLKGVAPPQITTAHIYRGIIPFIIIQLIGLSLVIFFPEMATWLPEYLIGK